MNSRLNKLASAILNELYSWSGYVEIPNKDYYRLCMHPSDYAQLFGNTRESIPPFIKSHFGPNIWLSQSIEQGKVYINPVDSFSNKEQDHGDLIKTLSLDD